jgi:putative ABC transport system permease protein
VLVDGRAPAGPGRGRDRLRAADDGGLRVGDVTTVRVPQPVEVTVVGVAELESGSSLGGVTFAFFDTSTAQQLLLGRSDVLSAVDLQVARPGVSPDQLRARSSRSIPDGTVAYTGAELTDQAMDEMESDFLGFFKVFLMLFALIALLVACFSISNTFSILVAQRTRESALLRALGASTRQILATVAGEALLIGAIASASGSPPGSASRTALNALMTASGAGVPSAGMTPGVDVPSPVIVTGIGVTLLAATLPAWRASRVAPLAALRDVAIDRSGASVWRAATGLVLTGGGAVALVIGPGHRRADDGRRTGSLASFVGVVLLGPVAARVTAEADRRSDRRLRGTNGKLARGNAMRNPKRTRNRGVR